MLAAITASGQSETHQLVQRRWFEARTAHFHTYSCGPTQAVAKLTARLEQFHDAYSALAGAEAVASPPIVVMAFPDVASLRGFVPLYQGKPGNMEGFFKRGSDENLIGIALTGQGSLRVIFHEYTHLLMRHNQPFWPIWLNEGMAEIYSTFEVIGSHGVRIGQPMPSRLNLLAHEPMLPLKKLLAVTHDSPEYNEQEQQGILYSQAWLLTHYLMLGNNAAHKARFGEFTTLLRLGQPSEQAFTNAFRTSLPVMEKELKGYLDRGRIESLTLSVKGDLTAPRPMITRDLPPVEIWFRLGDQLLRARRLDEAEACFREAQKLAPTNPLPSEGLGLLAIRRGDSAAALRHLGEALKRGSVSFLAHYEYARLKLEAGGKSPGFLSRMEATPAAEIRAELRKSLALMPDFGPANHLLGLFALIQGDDLAGAVKHLKRAIQLEPENLFYLLALAQAQSKTEGPTAARRTLESLRLSYIPPPLRAQAEELIKTLAK